jgi:hypothetical protein
VDQSRSEVSHRPGFHSDIFQGHWSFFPQQGRKGAKMKTLVIALVIGMVFCGGNIYAQEVGILGIELGKPLINCKEAEGKRPCYHKSGYGSGGLNEVLTYPEHGLGNLYVFIDSSSEKVMEISLLFNPDDKGDLILNLLIDKFGNPSKIKRFSVKKQMGTTFDNIYADWIIKGHSISFRKRLSKVNEGMLVLYHRDKVKELDEKERKRTKELKKAF